MRDYSKVSPAFWSGSTGRWIRAQGKDCVIAAMYLLTCPSSHMLGLYYLPLVTMAHETGLTIDEVRVALRRLSKAPSDAGEAGYASGFAWYDEPTEVVWVPQMARFQIGERLSANDNRVVGIRKDIERWRKCKFYAGFYELYNDPFCLGLEGPIGTCLTPSKALASQEQEQEHEKEQDPPNPPRGEQVGLALEGPTSEPDQPRNRGASKASVTRLATELLAELNAARKRVNPKNRELAPVEVHLKHIRERLLEGITADDIRHVIKVQEARSRNNPVAAGYFDSRSPFLKNNIGMWLAKTVEDSGRPEPQAGPLWGQPDPVAPPYFDRYVPKPRRESEPPPPGTLDVLKNLRPAP